MAHSPRQPRNRDTRRSAEARTRRLLLFALTALALIIAVVAALLRPASRSPVVAGPTAGPTRAATARQVATAQPSNQATPSDAVPPATTLAPTGAPTPEPVDGFFDPQRYSYEPEFGLAELQGYLDAQPGPLKGMRFQIGNRSQSFAEVLMGLSSLYSFNPKIVLALIEQHSRLLSSAQPSGDQFALALGITRAGVGRGVYAQLRLASVELRRSVRDYPGATQITFADGTRQPFQSNSFSRYALARVLAQTTTPGGLDRAMNGFLDTYARLFGDPRQVPTDWPPPAAPFLHWPLDKPARVTSFFDHDTPFLQENGTLVSYWGRTEQFLSYDGHTGWDYAVAPPDPVLAAANGTVMFAGNSDDGCGIARAVIINHHNGYRTLYWHLDSIAVEPGQEVTAGQQIGVAGATGCATGPHLHFQVQYLGRDVDPYGWCSSNVDPWVMYPGGQTSGWLWADQPTPCGPAPSDTVVVDNGGPGFASTGPWETSPLGYNGGALFIKSIPGAAGTAPYELRTLAQPAVAVWRSNLPHLGRYRVLVYIPYFLNGLDDAKDVRYRVRYHGGEAEVSVDGTVSANEWADLGTYTFDPAEPAQVSVSSFADGKALSVWADAVAWQAIDK